MKRYFYSLLALLGSVTGAFSQSMLISGGNDHAVALCNKGQIFAWGYNEGNRLGLKAPYDAQTIVTTPQMVDIPVGLTFSQVTAGSGSTNIALACTGVVYAWGGNKVGTAGQPTSQEIVSKPMPVPCGEATDHGFDEDGVSPGKYLGGVKMVGGTTSAGMALLDDGRAVIWGGNGRYQSGPTYPLLKQEGPNPVYVRDKSGKILENVIHISGGDNNMLLIVGASKDASVGVAYSMGGVNGRGVGATQDPSTYYAAPVEIIDEESVAAGTFESSGKYLEMVKTTGISDKGGFAVDENTGFLYGWGGNGWNGCIGLEKQDDGYVYASKVISGEYAKISGEAYMTNVHQVIGGNGYGACVTEDNYLLYWGVNTPNANNGGVIPNSEYSKLNGTNIEPGPVFANYCKGEKDPTKEVRVDDAMAIGRGDLFGFMVNKDGDFYVWGNTLVPGDDAPGGAGTLGLGFVGKSDDPEGKGYRTCLSKITLDCDPQDECPKVYMIGPRYKCPGESDSLYCGFTPTTRSIRSYYFRWSLDGVVQNTSTLQDAEDAANGNAAAKTKVENDDWNRWIVEIKDPGTYTVEIFYVGNNVPCTNCETAEGKIVVIDMDMPIDIDTTLMNCVVDTLKPAAVDMINFSAIVNNKFYKSTDKVTFAAFATPTSEDTLKDVNGKPIVINTNGAGGEIAFTVTGDNIDRTLGVEPRLGIDTLYHVWLEDITKFETTLNKVSTPTKADGGYQSYGTILRLMSAAELMSFEVYASGYNAGSSIKITPIILSAGKIKDNQYVVGNEFFRGKTQTFTIGTTPTKCEVEVGKKLSANAARGTEYVLALELSGDGCNIYKMPFADSGTGIYFTNPIEDPNGFGITITGAIQNSVKPGTNAQGYRGTPFVNVKFGKLTDYDCGRMPLSARYGCPPCKRPDDIVTIEVDGTKHATANDTINLCEESPAVELSVSGIEATDGVFDELWFLNAVGADASALQATKAESASTLKTKIAWVAAKAGTTEKYYVKVRDNEKPEASACYVFDSIVVRYYEKPVAPAIDDIEFCENEEDKSALVTALSGAVFTPYEVNWYADAEKSAAASEPDLTTLAAKATAYEFFYSVSDKATTCESDVKSFSVTVNAVPEEALEALTPFCKGDATVALATTSPTNSYKVTWYESDKTTAANTVLSTLAAGNYDYYYTLTSAAPANCVSDFLPYAFVVKDSTKVELDTTMACGITEVSVKSVNPSTASLAYTLGGTAVSVTTFENPTYKGEIGAIIATASADNYCDNTSAPLNLYVKATAVDPTTEKVTYLKSDAVNGVFKDLLTQNPSAVTAEDGYTLNWYATDKTTKLGACPTPAYPDASITEDQTYIYYVSATNEDGCESEKIAVEVTVFLTPAPTTSPVYYCVGAEDVVALTATVNDPNSSGKFKLNWYGLDGSNLGEDAPVPNVSAAGKFTYQVSQISTDGAESSKVDLDVIVYGVDKPTFKTSNVYEYCAAAGSGTALEVDLVRDAASYMEASDFVWSMKNASGVFETVTTPAPSLNVSATTTYEYQVYQTYTIPSTGKTCQGAPIETSVKVTFVPQLETKEVLYLKAAAVGGTFANNVLAQDPTAVSGQETGATLQWYESDCSTKISGTPTPTIDPSVREGDDQILTYCVSQVLNGCESEPQTITVRISDALPPTTYAYHYCEGQTMEDLKADINPQPGKSSDDYELYWYATQPAGTTTTPDFKGAVYSMNGAAAALDASNGVTKITYYVAQRDKATDAVSAALPVVITVYPKPVVVATDPDRVCETSVDLANSRSVANVAEPLTFEYSFEGGVPTTSSIANNSGKYSVEAYYSLPVTPSTYVVAPGLECRSTLPASITVQIDTLQDLTIDANLTTCPNTALESLEAVFTSNVAAPTYAWFNDKNMLTVTDRKQVASKDLPGVADDTYSFSVTVYAGACQLSASHTVTLGDGPVNGSIVASETINSQLDATAFATTGNAVDIYSCGTDVTLTASLDATESDFKWSVVSGSGSLSDNGKSAVVSPVTGPTTYRVTYTNKCSTSVDVNVIPMPVSASAILANSEICEDDQTTISLTYQSSEVPTITWTKDGQAYSPTSSELLSFAPAKPSDSGEYIYTVSNTHGCKVSNENEPLKLLVKPYIKVQDVAEPYIVTRGESVEMNVDIVYPTDASVSSISWTESGSEVNTGAKFTYAAVEADHNYDIVLHDDKYCDATTSVQLWVDAKLELTTSFDDTLCYSESREFVIDTTGTGPFRRNPAGVLKVVEVQDGLTTEITHLFEQRESLLVAALSPKKDASYLVSFDYNGQHLESSEAIVVLQPIEIELPAVQTVCEGTEVTIALPKVSPVGTTITWDEDPTIQSDLKAESIKVVAAFNSTAENHRATYTYGFTASYAGCQNLPMQVELLVDEPIAGEVVGETPICQGATTTLDASSFDASEYIWTASDDSTYYEMGATLTARLDSSRTFFLSMTRGTCAKDTMFDVKVTTIPEIVSVDSIGLRERKILLDPMKGTAPFQFALESEANVFPGDVAEDLTFTSHIVYVIDAVGCTNNFVFTLEAPSIFPKNVLTPDGDLVNDTWQVTNLREVYPDAKVRIFDRYGKKLIEYRGADDGWDGFYNGKAMPTTDYWYEIEIEEIDKTYVGHFTLMRR